jgi:transcriptional regulator with XRE-family HTH domain
VSRPEKPINPSSPYADLAQRLRNLREKHHLKYRPMAKLANYSKTELADAASARLLPTLEVTLAYATACEGRSLTESEKEEWVRIWTVARDNGKGNDS